MKSRVTIAFVLLYLSCLCGAAGKAADQAGSILWPDIEPFKTEYLQVSGIHQIYYELSGKADGIPVFVLHGGPGGHTSPYMRRFFNPEKFLIVLYDQRGTGKSKPFGELRENTTWTLVEDIEKLRAHLKLDKIVLFGGSWGTTLGLAYAEKYPRNVAGLVLRGVFTSTQKEINHFYHGGTAVFFPEVYDRLLASLPDPTRRPLPQYLYDLIQHSGVAERDKLCLAWARYEIRISALALSDEQVDQILGDEPVYTFGLFENYYMANGCFLEEGQLLRDATRLAGIPVIIVNGRYDTICPPSTAHELHKRIAGSKLVIADASGHWMGEPNIERALVEAMREFEK